MLVLSGLPSSLITKGLGWSPSFEEPGIVLEIFEVRRDSRPSKPIGSAFVFPPNTRIVPLSVIERPSQKLLSIPAGNAALRPPRYRIVPATLVSPQNTITHSPLTGGTVVLLDRRPRLIGVPRSVGKLKEVAPIEGSSAEIDPAPHRVRGKATKE